MKKRYYIVMATLLLGVSVAKSQDHIKLDLQKTIQLANDSSLEAFRTQNMYLSGYWEYRTYKANRLPSLTLNMTPPNITGILPSDTIRKMTWMFIVANSRFMLPVIWLSSRIST